MSNPIVNGVAHDFSSVELRIGANTYNLVKEIKYSDNLEPGEVYGTSAQLLARTRGQYKAEGSLTFYKGEADKFIAAIGGGFYEAIFDVVVNYGGSVYPVTTDVLQACRLKKRDRSNSSGSEALEDSFDLSVMIIKWNGLYGLKTVL